MTDDSISVWEGIYESFDDVPARGPGFDGETWNKRTKAMIKSELAAWRDDRTPPPGVVFRNYLLPIVTAMADAGRRTLGVLDFGGGMGASFLSLLATLSKPERIDYHIVERAEVCRAARRLFDDEPRPTFHEDMPEASLCVDIVHAGSSMQYVRDWKGMLARFAAYEPSYILFSDLMAGDIPTFATVQNYYGSAIPCWWFNAGELIDVMSSLHFTMILRAPFLTKYLGVEGPLPTQNFPPECRLEHTCHMLFSREPVTAPAGGQYPTHV